MNKQENKTGSIKKGILYVLLAHVIYSTSVFVLGWIVVRLGLILGICKETGNWNSSFCAFITIGIIISSFFLWLIQFIYVIPIAIYFRKEKQTLKGTLIASGITFLLGCGIFGAMMLPNMFK